MGLPPPNVIGLFNSGMGRARNVPRPDWNRFRRLGFDMSYGAPGTAGSVLVVEDDPDLRAVYADVLAAEGYQVSVAADGYEAIAILTDGGVPCAVLLDLRMPGMNGWELADRMHNTADWQAVPIIVVAAHYLVADEARKIGAEAWLQKPVSLPRLVSVVQRMCRGGGGSSGLTARPRRRGTANEHQPA
jgi:CheY-like chemotaxis protein